MEKKSKIAILFGGQSVEHQISLLSAKNVVEHLNREKYELFLVGINEVGQWHLYDEEGYLQKADDPERIRLGSPLREFHLFHEEIDIAFPILHGTNGEDGTVQGYLKLAGIPFVGAGVLGSAIGMDKDVAKRLIRDAKIPTSDFFSFEVQQREEFPYEKVCSTLSSPFFVKPTNSGSSIGISKAFTEEEYLHALDLAFTYDCKVVVEETIDGVELQLGVIGNKDLMVSVPCQITPKGELHTYASKYLDADGAKWEIPAPLGCEMIEQAQELARKVYRVLCCKGMARVDLFLSKDGLLWFNEINTIPGLTKQSPFAKMFEASGLSFRELLDHLLSIHREDSVPVFSKL